MKQNPRTGNWEHSNTKPKEETGAPAPAKQPPASAVDKTKSKAKPKAKPGRG